MAKSERIGVYPGTFDPTTNGHMDVIRRGARVLDRLVIGVAVNAGKGPLFSLDERVEMVQDEVASIDDPRIGVIEVKPFNSLLMHFAETENAQVILRGLRAVSDFDYEFQMAGMNARLNPDIEMMFLMASETNQFIASRLVKEIAALGGDISSFVSKTVADRVNERYGRLDLQAANE